MVCFRYIIVNTPHKGDKNDDDDDDDNNNNNNNNGYRSWDSIVSIIDNPACSLLQAGLSRV